MTNRFWMAVVCLTLAAGTVGAQEGDQRGPRGPRDPERRQRILEEFDVDGDGKLSQDERQAAREAMRERRGRRGGPEGGPPRGGRRGPGRGGPPMPPPPELFDMIDEDGDGVISKDQFVQFIEEMHAKRGGPRGEGRRPHGPRGEGRRPGPPPVDPPPVPAAEESADELN